MTNEFTALEPIAAPDSFAFGYMRGDAVGADVVKNWGLEVGVQVCEGDLAEEVRPNEAGAAQPGPEANYAAWQTWAVANGMPQAEAEAASMEQLQGWNAPDDSAGRPADSAVKADWVAYVEANGADVSWAEASTTTKADLQAWQPGDVTTDVAADGHS